MAEENEAPSSAASDVKPAKPPLDRRELVKKLGKAAALPVVVAAFIAADVPEAAAY